MEELNAGRQQPSKKRPDKAIRYAFMVDWFGFDVNLQPTSVGHARNAVKSLFTWEKTIEMLWGDVSTALAAAGRARILSASPAWGPIANARGQLAALEKKKLSDSVEIVNRLNPNRPDQHADEKTYQSVEEIRNYFRMLDDWAQVIQGGVWAAIVAAYGSIEDTPRSRRLRGLDALTASYEFNFNELPENVFAHLRALASTGASPMPKELEAAMDARDELVRPRVNAGSFSEDPKRLDTWLQALLDKIEPITELPSDVLRKVRGSRHSPSRATHKEGSKTIEAVSWVGVERAYWQQWQWPPSGAASRNKENPDVSILDLLYTARHGGLQVVPWRGGMLSICQWSRILAIALRRNHAVPVDTVNAALANLGFVELKASAPKGADPGGSLAISGFNKDDARANLRGHRQDEPVLLLSPRSSHSECWTWGPYAGIRALALMPREIDEADRLASTHGESIARADALPPSTDCSDPILELAHLISDRLGRVRIIRFVEVGETTGAQERTTDDALARQYPGSTRVFFGTGVAQFDLPSPYFGNPRSIEDLMARFYNLFPEPKHLLPKILTILLESFSFSTSSIAAIRIILLILDVMSRPFPAISAKVRNIITALEDAIKSARRK